MLSSHRPRPVAAAALVMVPLAAHVLLAGGAGAATKKKATKAKAQSSATSAPAAGKACATLNQQSGGLDCVSVGKALQWQPRGSRANPYRFGDVGEYTAYEGNRYRLKVSGFSKLTLDDIHPGGTGKYAVPAGMAPVRVDAELTYLGPKPENDLPASITSLALVDANNQRYETYAGDDKAGGECQQFGEVPNNGTRHLVKDAPLTTGLCVVVTTAQVGPSLLLNLNWNDDKNGIWFKTTA